jgi:hypothetical protein
MVVGFTTTYAISVYHYVIYVYFNEINFIQNFKEMSINGPITKYEVEFNKTGGRSENRMINGADQSRYTLTNIPNNVSGYQSIISAAYHV